jgi:hypothetical protein
MAPMLLTPQHTFEFELYPRILNSVYHKLLGKSKFSSEHLLANSITNTSTVPPKLFYRTTLQVEALDMMVMILHKHVAQRGTTQFIPHASSRHPQDV